MIVDAHAHIYDYLAGYGAKGEFRPLGNGKGIWATGEVEQFFPAQYGDLGFRAEALLGLMEEAGIDHAVLLQGGNYGFHNDYCAEVARQYPEKFTAIATVDPYAFYAQEILDHLIGDYGMRGLKFELSQTWGMTGYHADAKLDGPVFAKVLERAEKENMTVTIDMGPVSASSFDPEGMINAAKRYPGIQFIFCHCCFPCDDGQNGLRLEWMGRMREAGILFDISNLLAVWPEEPPFPKKHAFLKEVKAVVGAERMIWGTDVPGILRKFTYKQLMAMITDSGAFTPEELTLVMGENARSVYGIK